PYQYKIGSGSLQSSPAFSSLAAGTYTITVSDANAITSTVSVTITQPSPPTTLAVIISSQTNVTAFGVSNGSVTVAGSGGTGPYQYKIGTGTLQSSPTFSSLAAGPYTITVSDVNSITSTVSVTITQPATLAVTISSQTNVIAFSGSTGAVTVIGTGGASPYQYKMGTGALQSSSTFSSLSAGTYTITVSDANSITSTVSVTITQPSSALAVTISSQTNVTAFGASTGVVTVAGSGGTSPYQYKIGAGSLQSSPTFSSLATGSYIVTIRDANGVTSTVSITIGQPSSPLTLAVSSQTNVAPNGGSLGSVTVLATGGTGPYQYKIGTGSLQSSPTFTGFAAGPYTITVTDANGITSTVTVTVAQVSQPITFVQFPSKTYGDADFAPGANSNNSTIPIVYSSDNSAVATIINGNIHIVGAGTANITASQAAISIASQLTVAKAQLTVKADNKGRQYGTANPALTITYSGFVNGEDINKLTTPPIVATLATATTSPGNYQITPSSAAAYNYSFNYVAGTLTIIPLTNAVATNLTIGSGTLSPTFASGTFAYTISVGYNVNYITLTPTFDPTASATIYGTPVPNGSPSYNIGLNAGNNVITLVITAQDGVTKNTYTLTVYRALPPSAIIPTNFLSPNGDGKNDGWVIKDIQLYPGNTVTIFDKAGRVIYTKHNYNNDWNGTMNGSPLVQGTYYYVIQLGPTRLKGYVTILRSH
ncbi:gliding motility-associated C-terminal domain-containing protein, partial [Mucilaginibacter sp.]|uniref:T9SS type B sorting domain-containing protein n=1 Tax=Mucilaginibacter sp. TaxID=1882438 RepID=UPI002612CFC9